MSPDPSTGEWHLEKHGGQARRGWRKLHLGVDPDTDEILASALTGSEEGDVSLVGPLLDQITCSIGAVLADGAYDGEPVYRAIAKRAPDAEVIIPPRAAAVCKGRMKFGPSAFPVQQKNLSVAIQAAARTR